VDEHSTLELADELRVNRVVDRLEELLNEYLGLQQKITGGGDRAFYSPTLDFISLPPEHAFRGPPEWAATALHELGHWTAIQPG